MINKNSIRSARCKNQAIISTLLRTIQVEPQRNMCKFWGE